MVHSSVSFLLLLWEGPFWGSLPKASSSLDDDDDARFKVSKMCVKKGSKIRFPIVVVVVVVVGIGIVFNTSYLRTNALPRSVPTVD